MSRQYILAGHTPVVCPDVRTWGQWMEQAERHVGLSQVTPDVKVSTVFLGIDHSFDDGPPLLFETMIFGGEHDQWQDRYATWDEAEAGHARAVKMATGEISEEE